MSLSKLLAALNALEPILEQEQQLLCQAPSTSSALQSITDSKQELLATIAWLESKCRPQDKGAAVAGWPEVEAIAQRLARLNQHNGWLLEQQISQNQQALQLFARFSEPALYGADGQTKESLSAQRKISI